MDSNFYKEIGRAGALARIKKYGNPGTPEGRRLGGIRSIEAQKKLKSGFKILKDITIPPYSIELAELIGVFMGDGHVDIYQATVTTNRETDLQHAKYIQSQIEKLFNLKAELRLRKPEMVCVVVVSSKKFCDYLRSQGQCSHKIQDGVSIPVWIRTNKEYSKSLARGLFDTDGCAYIDKHKRKEKHYQHMALAFRSHSENLLSFFKDVLIAEGLHPTQKTKYTVFLRREADIRRYFQIIGTSNEKHTLRIASILNGGVA